MLEAAQRAWKTLCLDDIAEGDVTLSIDTSGSMYVYLDFVRREISRWLRRQCQQRPARRFNLVQYASIATRWQPKSVTCSHDNVAAAETWLAKQHCSTSSNLLDGLVCAFADLFVEAVYVLCDGTTDYPSSLILESVMRASRGRPVHVFLFQHEGESCQLSRSAAVYEQLALKTGGLLQLVHVPKLSLATPRGGVNFLVTPVLIRVDTYVKSARQREEQATCSVIGKRPTLPRANAYITNCKTAWELIGGLRVIARRNRDGIYYTGQIHDQLDNTTVQIQFSHSFHGSFDFFQATPISDIVSLVDARRQPVTIGDYTLTLYGDKGAYYPGLVTDETYSRLEGKSLTVTLFDGTKLFHVTGDKAVRISQDKYERLAKELRLRERDLTNTTADTSVEEEKKLQQELDILRGSNSSQTAQHRSKIAPSVSLQGSSVINGTETDCGLDDKPTISELSEQELTRLQSRTEATQSQVERPTGLKPGKVISLGLSYVDGYKAGYRDGRSTAEELHKVIQEKRTRPQWKWWGRSPKPISSVHPHRSFGTSQDLSDIDAVIRSRHHRCVHAKVDAHVARSQSLTAVHQYKRPNKTTAKDVIYQRPHTADPSESKRIEYRSERQRQIQEGVNKTRLNHQMQQAACDEFKRSRHSQQRNKEAERVSVKEQTEHMRSLHKQKLQKQHKDRETVHNQEQQQRKEATENCRRDRQNAHLEWKRSIEASTDKQKEQRIAAVKQRAEDRYKEASRRWEETKQSQDNRLKHLQARSHRQEKKLEQRTEKEERDLDIDRYTVTHNKLMHRATLVP